MECTRCHGFMAKERLYDLLENDGQVYASEWRWAYRCVACGKVESGERLVDVIKSRGEMMTCLREGRSRKLLGVVLCLLLALPGWAACAPVMASSGEAPLPAMVEPPADPWPRQLTSEDNTFSVFQPQYERWEQGRLDGRAAVAVEDQASPQPRYGVIWFTARTQIDKETRMVTLEDLAVSKADFPTVPDGGAGYLAALRQPLSAPPLTIALDRLQAELEVERVEDPGRIVPVMNDPPRIIVSEAPALLVRLDGQPVLRSVDGTSLLRVINTRVLLLLDQSAGRYYLWLMNRWLTTPNFDGPWADQANPPASLETAKQAAVQSGQVDLLDNRTRSQAAPSGRSRPAHLREHHSGRARRGQGPARPGSGDRHLHPGGDQHRRRPLPVHAGAGVLRAPLGPVVPRQVAPRLLGVRGRGPGPSRLRQHSGEPSQGGSARLRFRDAPGAAGSARQRYPADGHDQPERGEALAPVRRPAAAQAH